MFPSYNIILVFKLHSNKEFIFFDEWYISFTCLQFEIHYEFNSSKDATDIFDVIIHTNKVCFLCDFNCSSYSSSQLLTLFLTGIFFNSIWLIHEHNFYSEWFWMSYQHWNGRAKTFICYFKYNARQNIWICFLKINSDWLVLTKY